MAERAYTIIDKTGWGDGPWQNEPDKIQFTDDATGLDCLIVRNHMGSLCGYVGVPPEHPWHGIGYSESFDGELSPELKIKVHGGLTYSAPCEENEDEATGICHIPDPGRPDNVWWFGFDCNHAFDYAPGYQALGFPSIAESLGKREVYRDVSYVRGECASLAKQLAAVTAETRSESPSSAAFA